jgi:uncharacterized repeat protein (TIGR02543 family)
MKTSPARPVATPPRGSIRIITAAIAALLGVGSACAESPTIVKDYTFNAGAETDFTPGEFRAYDNAISYLGGKVRLEGFAKLDQYNFSPAIPDGKVMIEMVVSYQSLSTNERIFGFIASNGGYGFKLGTDGKVYGYSDHRGTFGPGVTTTPNTPIVLAYVRDIDGVDALYVNGVLSDSFADTSSFGDLSTIRLACKYTDPPGDPAPTTIDVDQYRVSTFSGTFDTAWLMTAASPAPDQEPTVYMASPAEGAAISKDDTVSVTSEAYFGTGPLTVQYSMCLVGGTPADVGSPVSTPPSYELNLGLLAPGTYEIKATVTDSTSGTPRTGVSTVHTFTVYTPAQTIIKDYTFNTGPEPDLTAGQYRDHNTAIIYTSGKARLEGNAWLDSTFSPAIPDNKIMVEAIVSRSSLLGSRMFGCAGIYQFCLYDNGDVKADSDMIGSAMGGASTTADTPVRLAYVRDVNGGTGGVPIDRYYVNGALVGSYEGAAAWWSNINQIRLGSRRDGWTGNDVPTTIDIDQYRLSTFTGAFDPSWLLTEATPVPILPPQVVISVKSPRSDHTFWTPDEISLSAVVFYGTEPYSSLTYHIHKLPAGPDTVISAVAPYQVTLGPLAAGTYEIHAEVADSHDPIRTAISVTDTITVGTPTRDINKDYTFNDGAEADFTAGQYRDYDNAITYANGKARLEGFANLDQRNFTPTIADGKVMIEMVMSYQTLSTNDRIFGFIASNGGYGFKLGADGKVYGYSDHRGGFGPGVATTPNTRIILAYVRDNSQQDRLYVNGALSYSFSDPNSFGDLSTIRLGCKYGDDPGDPAPTTIDIDQYRVSTFIGAFDTSWLMTRATGSGTAYALSYDGNTHTGGTAPVDGNLYNSGESVTLAGAGSLVKTGHTFMGWTEAANGSGTVYPAAAEFVMPDGEVILYAKWALNTYTLSYTAEANGSIAGITPQTVNYNVSGSQVTAVPASGYHFVKWSDNVMTASRTDTPLSANISVSASFAIHYTSWAAANGITGQPADGDFDNDGVDNAVEMVVGGLPSTRMDANLMPTIQLVTDPGEGVPAGNYMLFTYRRTDLSVAAGVTAACQYNLNLGATWTTAVNDELDVKVLEDDNYAPYGTATDRVRVYVPRGANTKMFGRLDVLVPAP